MKTVTISLFCLTLLAVDVVADDPFAPPSLGSNPVDPFAAPTSSWSSPRSHTHGDRELKNFSVKETLTVRGYERDDMFVLLKQSSAFRKACSKYSLEDPATWEAVRSKVKLKNAQLEKDIEEAESMSKTRDTRSPMDGRVVSAANVRQRGKELYQKAQGEYDDNESILRIVGELESNLAKVKERSSLTDVFDIKNSSGQGFPGKVVMRDGDDAIIYKQGGGYFRVPMSALAEETVTFIDAAVIDSQSTASSSSGDHGSQSEDSVSSGLYYGHVMVPFVGRDALLNSYSSYGLGLHLPAVVAFIDDLKKILKEDGYSDSASESMVMQSVSWAIHALKSRAEFYNEVGTPLVENYVATPFEDIVKTAVTNQLKVMKLKDFREAAAQALRLEAGLEGMSDEAISNHYGRHIINMLSEGKQRNFTCLALYQAGSIAAVNRLDQLRMKLNLNNNQNVAARMYSALRWNIDTSNEYSQRMRSAFYSGDYAFIEHELAYADVVFNQDVISILKLLEVDKLRDGPIVDIADLPSEGL